METPVSACSSCGAEIKWGKTEASGKMMPLNPKPVPGGNVVIVDRVGSTDIVRVLGKGDPSRAAYVSHFVSCESANAHRKPPT